MPETGQLTPAQIEFLDSHVAAFDPLDWTAECAGLAGSDRRFLRVRPNDGSSSSYILVIWDSTDHDWSRFLGIAADVAGRIDLLPQIYASDPKHGLILEEDLGGTTLKAFSAEADEMAVRSTYGLVVERLAEWHQLGENASPVVSCRAMDMEMFLWETRYFADHCVVDYFGKEGLMGEAWENERRGLADEAAALPRVCMHRDFQSENILLHDGRVRFVDYQGARMGPAAYDLASLLLDPYVSLGRDRAKVEALVTAYEAEAKAGVPERAFRVCAVQRLSQALGAFANLSIHKGRERYRDYIPVALRRLASVLGQGELCPVLTGIVNACLASLGSEEAVAP